MIRLFLLSIAGCFAFGFSNRQTSYEITYANDGVYEPVSRYASKIILRRFRQRLLINEKLSYFYNLWNDSDPLKRKNIDSFELNNSNYYNSTNGVIYTVKVLPREIGTLLVADTLAEEDWIFTNE